MMKYLDDIQNARSDPKSLETLYRAALEENVGDEFKSALLACYEEAPANVLYETWFYRLEGDERTVEKAGRGTNWKLAIPLAVLNGLIFWLLSHEDLTIFNRYPHLFLLWSPIAAIFAMAFLVIAGKREKLPSGLIGLGVLVLPAYVLLFVPVQRFFLRNYYLDLMLMHVPLLVWIGVGRSVLGPKSDPKSRLAFVIKTFEVIVTGGLFIIAGGIFSGITVGMFQALNIDIPEAVLRLFFAGGFGALPVIVVASVYNPLVKPA
ncbi:MAG: hypothetical protein ACE5GO_10375, partial [Anaerolineales bacterium]